MRLGLLARIILIVALALLAIQLLALLIYFGATDNRAVFGAASGSLPRQVAGLVRLVEKAPPDLRASVLDAFSQNGRSLAIVPGPPPDEAGVAALNRIEIAIKAVLASDGAPGRHVLVLFDPRQGEHAGETLRVYVQLASGDYLLLDVQDKVTVRVLGVPIGFFAGLFGVLVAVAALVAVAREMKPLTRLARDVDRVGEHLDPVPIPETGAPELRALIHAVNAMQERIATLVKNRTLTLGAISHDLRTYLTRLRLRIEMMPESRHRDGAIGDVEAMQALVEDTLDFAQSSFASAEPAACDPGAVLARYCAGHVEAGRITLTLPAVALRVAMAETVLERLCANLIENALRYGHAAFVRVEGAPGAVVLVVEDEGPGIAPEERAKVFEPFYRIEASRSRDSGGAGLGLTIVKRIVALHGGTAALGDSGHGGLAVTVCLPAA
ncbi:ATP-binding protein [Ancylobacter pratisalsi]|uniref:histidine kinase n=1 Tax=Ancylobacter pratisalsi TaxID=1745854 RepID=A0A6P1YUB6_9HYPH|nr:ATP-binding protein [Ancylobacter pratisalsi]QIB35204.1 HAMP domain-containing protein [Ancylobacter pratisalsi]